MLAGISNPKFSKAVFSSFFASVPVLFFHGCVLHSLTYDLDLQYDHEKVMDLSLFLYVHFFLLNIALLNLFGKLCLE